MKHKLQLASLTVLAAVAFGYLAVSAVAFFAFPNAAHASTAPSGSFSRKLLGETDYVYNWDFTTYSYGAVSSKVDWGMRFIFKNDAEVDYVKGKLNGSGSEPYITPTLTGTASAKWAHVDDGHQEQSSYWDRDRGLKDVVNCNWNYAHMRFYANTDNDRSYNNDLGYYVVASLHRDNEGWPCENEYASFEEDEDWWFERIDDNLDDSPYDWDPQNNITNWRNDVTGVVSIGGVNDDGDPTHRYESDGWGVVVDIPNQDD